MDVRLPQFWYVACLADDLGGRRPLARSVLGVRMALFRDQDGRAAAVVDCCPHRNTPLSVGTVGDGLLRCAYHGWRFDGTGDIAAKVVVAACVVSVAIKLSSFPAVYALYTSSSQLSPDVARSLWTIDEFAALVSMLVQGLSLAAVAASGLVFGGIPRWLAGTAGVIAVGMVVGWTFGGNAQIAPTIAWLLWLLVGSVALFVRAPRAAIEGRQIKTALSPGAA